MRKLLFTLTLGLAVISIGFSQTGTLTNFTFPATAEQGETINLSVNRTNDVDAYAEVAIYKVIGGVQDWTSIGWANYTGLTATASPTALNMSITIPGATATSASISPDYYIAVVILKASADNAELAIENDLDGSNDITINASSSVLTTIDFASEPVSTVNAGGDVTINFEYTLSGTGQVKVEVARYADAWTNEATIVEEAFDPLSATTTTPVASSSTLTIPGGTPASSTLTGTKNYKIAISVFNDSWVWVQTEVRDLTITVATGIDDDIAGSSSVYPNPASGVINVPAGVVSISDLTGQVVVNAEGTTADVSALAPGVYIVTDVNGVASRILVE